jgi:hypothetical protein
MGNRYNISEIRSPSGGLLTFAQQQVLERAVGKMILLGELVGVTADQMILLLESGLTVNELLQYLGARMRQEAEKRDWA